VDARPHPGTAVRRLGGAVRVLAPRSAVRRAADPPRVLLRTSPVRVTLERMQSAAAKPPSRRAPLTPRGPGDGRRGQGGSLGIALIALVHALACSGGAATPTEEPGPGASGGASGSRLGGAGQGGAARPAGAGGGAGSPGPGAGGSTAGGGMSAGGASGGGGSTDPADASGVLGVGGAAVGPGDAGAADRAADRAVMASADGAGPSSLAGCKDPSYPVCVDFETRSLPAAWRAQGTGVAVSTGKAAHGEAALHIGNVAPFATRTIVTSQLAGVGSVMWGRFYLYASPGMPNGHGAMVMATDQAGNWYELGFQFGAYHGNWHPPAGVPERWMNSKVMIPGDKWTCVEFQFDGATPAVTKIWSDGVEVKYSQAASSPALVAVQSWRRLEVGFKAFHGTSIKSYEGMDPPALMEMWIDDLAIDGKRIGCIK
jgi:hypothetical protein